MFEIDPPIVPLFLTWASPMFPANLARAGIALLTPAYLAGRFWTERELGVLLNKETLIPVLKGCTFEDVSEYSGILPDLAGFVIDEDQSEEAIALKIAPAVKIEELE